jgi:PhzF family phenazine biosynthesis protein
MQAIAREFNNSETAFILSSDGPDHDVRIRFFTPSVEVPSCGHATVAAHYVRAIENNLPSCKVIQKIGIGILPVEIQKEPDDYKIIMTQGELSFSEPLEGKTGEEILNALGLSPSDLDKRCPVQIVSTGHSKVIIGIKETDKLNSISPVMTRLSEISRKIQCNGYFVFTFNSSSEDILTHGRMFAPAIGIPEDPVTGNANGPLGAYLIKHRLVSPESDLFQFKSKQGEAMGRPGIVEIQVEIKNKNPVQVKVGGYAVIVFKTEMII